jgi:hypothetical protein
MFDVKEVCVETDRERSDVCEIDKCNYTDKQNYHKEYT